MPLRANMEPQDFIEIFSRRKWLIIFSILVVMFGAGVYCVVVPDQYKSSTTILVIPQKVSEDLVRSTVRDSMQERLTALQQQVLSRTRLITVIDDLGLYEGERGSAPPEALVAKIRKRIGFDVIRGKNAFTLSFEHENPKTAMRTTARLASFFIEENIRERELAATGTTEFLDAQLLETKARLEEQEEKVKRYKMQYLGELPQQMEVNLNLLSRLQEQEKSYAEAIARAEDRKVFLESEISRLQRQVNAPKDPTDLLFDQLASKQKELQDLTSKYTESYPTVIQLRREIEILEAKILALYRDDAADNAAFAGTVTVGSTTIRRTRRESDDIRRLRDQVASLNLEITALRREKEQNRRNMNSIETRVGRLPQREQELVSLTRDYENLKRSYDELLKKKLQAGISQNLEEVQKGEQFQILDPAILPTTPFKPNRNMVVGYAFLFAVALGFGGALGLEIIDPTLRNSKEFKYFFDLPIMATFPVIRSGEYTAGREMQRKALLAGIVSIASAVTVFLLLYQKKIRAILNISGVTE